jgi:thiamine pyrophosphate-dependent acetolactate synthase large subunit-like protein
LTNLVDGVDTLVIAKPPMSTLTITGRWRVRHTHLTEDVEIDGNLIFKKMAKSNVEKTHPQQHVELIQHARV